MKQPTGENAQPARKSSHPHARNPPWYDSAAPLDEDDVMNPTRQGQVLSLLDQALQTPPGSRAALLDAACGGDEELRREVEEILALETAVEGFLPVSGPPGLPPGYRIGPYRV